MQTRKIIEQLRFEAGWYEMTDPDLGSLLNAAADRLEELDERVAIMSENEPGGDVSFGHL